MDEVPADSSQTDVMVDHIKFVAYSVIANIIVCFGIVGNLLNLLVLTRPSLKGVMYVYLLGLAVSNLCVLVSAAPALFDISQGFSSGNYVTAFYQAHLELPLINSFMASSVYIIICMTVNRYISIHKPTHFQRIHTHTNAHLSILASFFCGILLNIPLCFQNAVVLFCPDRRLSTRDARITLEYDLDTTQDDPEEEIEEEADQEFDRVEIFNVNPANGQTIARVHPNDTAACTWKSEENLFVMDHILFKVYLFVSEVLLRVGPILILATLNILIINKFLKIARKRQILKGSLSPVPEVTSSRLEIPNNVNSLPSSPFTSTRNTSSTTQSSSATTSSSAPTAPSNGASGSHLAVPGSGVNAISRSPSPEPLSSVCSPSCTPAHHQRKRSSKRKNRSLQSPEERMLVVVLVSIVVLFVICTTPAAVLSILHTRKLDKHLGFQVFRGVANDLELLNFALNFYIYCLCSAEIRMSFMDVFESMCSILKCKKASRVPGDAVVVRVDHV